MAENDERSLTQPATEREWLLQFDMQMRQMNSQLSNLQEHMHRELKGLKQSFNGLANMEKSIQADLQMLKRDENRVRDIEVDVSSLKTELSRLSGQFKIVTGILSLALTAVFGLVFSYKAPSPGQKIEIKFTKDAIEALRK